MPPIKRTPTNPVMRPILVKYVNSIPLVCNKLSCSRKQTQSPQSQSQQEENNHNYTQDNFNHGKDDITSQLEEARIDSRDLPMADESGLPSEPDMTAGPIPLAVTDLPESIAFAEPNRWSSFDVNGRSSRSTNQTSVSPNVMSFTSNETPYSVDLSARPDRQRILSSESLSQRSEKEELEDIFSEIMTGSEHEIAFLTRHYAEFIGPWYNLISCLSIITSNN